jgi:hypothetical protein
MGEKCAGWQAGFGVGHSLLPENDVYDDHLTSEGVTLSVTVRNFPRSCEKGNYMLYVGVGGSGAHTSWLGMNVCEILYIYTGRVDLTHAKIAVKVHQIEA